MTVVWIAIKIESLAGMTNDPPLKRSLQDNGDQRASRPSQLKT